MKKEVFKKIQVVVWILGFVAVGLLIYGIIRTILA